MDFDEHPEDSQGHYFHHAPIKLVRAIIYFLSMQNKGALEIFVLIVSCYMSHCYIKLENNMAKLYYTSCSHCNIFVMFFMIVFYHTVH